MKSSENALILPDEVMNKVHKVILKIKYILRESPDFFKTLINDVLQVGKKIDDQIFIFDNVKSKIYSTFPNLMDYTEGPSLIRNSSKLSKILVFKDHSLKTVFCEMGKKHLLKEIRESLEEEILTYSNTVSTTEFLNFKMDDLQLMGDTYKECMGGDD